MWNVFLKETSTQIIIDNECKVKIILKMHSGVFGAELCYHYFAPKGYLFLKYPSIKIQLKIEKKNAVNKVVQVVFLILIFFFLVTARSRRIVGSIRYIIRY